jgi:5'-3' exonuclease
MHLHVDSDSLVYAVGFAVQDKDKQVEPLSHVLSTVKRSVTSLIESVENTGYTLYLTGHDNFRMALYPEYKANRKADKPLMYHVIRDYLEETWGAKVITGMEADDAVAIAITDDPTSCVVSMDKDLLTVPGLHMNPRKLEEGVFLVPECEATLTFYRQLLTGDTSDNVPGVGDVSKELKEKYGIPPGRRGFGPASAAAVLPAGTTEAECFSRVREVYSNDGVLLRNGRLLHMTRKLHEDGTPVLWEFPNGI